MKKIILKIDGMSCSACSQGLEKYLNKQSGIRSASVNLVLAEAVISYDDELSVRDLEKFIEEAGFKSLGVSGNEKDKKKKIDSKILLIIGGLLVFLLLYVTMGNMIGLPSIPFLDMDKNPTNYIIFQIVLTIIFLIYGFDILKSGFKNAYHLMPNMDTLVSLGVIASLLYSLYNTALYFTQGFLGIHNLYFESSVVIIYFVKLGRFISNTSFEKTREALKDLVQITPQKAILKNSDGEREVTLDEVACGDILICKPGYKIAADGVIIQGKSHIDESFITGESLPVKKSINDKVIAGSVNIDGYLEYRAEKVGKESTISEIVRLVSESVSVKTKYQELADRISSYFVPAVFLIAVGTLLVYLLLGNFSLGFTSFVTVLVAACPCALGLATPLAVIVSSGVCAKNAILIKSNKILESICNIDTIVFDKTGTLTYGNLQVSKIYNYSKYSISEIMKIVSSIEDKSEHPIGRAFTLYAKDKSLEKVSIGGFKNISGMGVKAYVNNREFYLGSSKLLTKLKIENNHVTDEEKLSSLGNSLIYVIEKGKIIALIGVKDIVRDNAKEVISKLKNLNKEVIMLTGDNEKTSSVIARELGISKVLSNVMPKEKGDMIKSLISSNKKVMMVGDGINDAIGLTASDVSVSFGSATDIAANSSSVILLKDDLSKIILLFEISKRTLRIIKENLFWAFFYNTFMIVIATGILRSYGISMNPMIASFAMTISSVTVALNSLRLGRMKNSR